jgi:hypothetical protein
LLGGKVKNKLLGGKVKNKLINKNSLKCDVYRVKDEEKRSE